MEVLKFFLNDDLGNQVDWHAGRYSTKLDNLSENVEIYPLPESLGMCVSTDESKRTKDTNKPPRLVNKTLFK